MGAPIQVANRHAVNVVAGMAVWAVAVSVAVVCGRVIGKHGDGEHGEGRDYAEASSHVSSVRP